MGVTIDIKMTQKKVIRRRRSDTKIGTIEKQYGVEKSFCQWMYMTPF